MFEFLKRILRPPVFENEKDTHKAYLLNMILWGLIFITIPYLILVQIFQPEGIIRALIQAGIGLTIYSSLLFFMHRGYVRQTSAMHVIMIWVFITAVAFSSYGVQDETYSFGYFLVILIAGVLLGPKPALGFAILSLISGGVMMYLNSLGIIPSPTNASPSLTWIISIISFPMIVLLQYLSSRTLNKALERVRLSEEKQKLISKVSTDYTFESAVTETGEVKTVWLAGAFKKMTGYTPEEYLAKGGWYGHIHPEDVAKDDFDMQKLVDNQDVVDSEIRTFAKDGTIRWERVFAHPIWDEKKNRLTGIVGAVQDITKQKLAEQNLRELLLQQMAILNNIPDIAWLKDKDGRYIAVNDQFFKLVDLHLNEIIGKTDHDMSPKDLADFYVDGDRKVMENKQRLIIEEKTTDKYGTIRWAETTKTPIFNSAGEVVGTTGISRDITERKLAEIERETLIKELEAKNIELERFTYTVSHDLKAPLVTITGFLSYLERDARAGDFDKFNKDLARIHQAADKMQNLLKDLLELSRIGRIMNEPMEMHFGELVQEALALVDGNIKAKKVQIEFKDDGYKIYGDRIRLVEVLQNLMENAVKFMGDQPNPLIRIGSIADSERPLTFFVQDNGIGIDPKFIDRIFGLFNKLDSDTLGSGIGLTLVKRIIEVHGGKIWVESKLGEGSIFYFTLA